MDQRWLLSRRKFLHTLAGSGVIAAGDLAWWEAPLLAPRKAFAAEPVRFQFSVPEPTRITLVTSLVQRFNQSQKDFEVKVEFVPQAQARQKLISAVSAGSPPDVCQIWDNWIGQFQGMGAVEDLTSRVKSWKHRDDVQDTAWQTVSAGNAIVSMPLALTLDGIFYRTDRLRELGLKEPATIGSVVASDAFFPFADGLLVAIEAGATAVIQPGGSVRDDEVIKAADDHGIAMVFTDVRHFRH